MSPVKWRLIESGGLPCARPPPVPPPLIPRHGPIEGSRSATTARRPIRQSACPSPIVTVVFPSPGGVGVMDETTTSLPDGASRRAASARMETLATSRPKGTRSASVRPTLAATSVIGRGRDGVTVDTGTSSGARAAGSERERPVAAQRVPVSPDGRVGPGSRWPRGFGSEERLQPLRDGDHTLGVRVPAGMSGLAGGDGLAALHLTDLVPEDERG